MSRFEWPVERNFKSALACKNLPPSGSGKVQSQLLGPITNLLPLYDHLTVFVFSWTLLLVCYAVNRYVLPINKLNSSDGQYIDESQTMLASLIIYYLLSFFIIGSLYQSSCDLLEEQATEYLYGNTPPIPATLESSSWAPMLKP